ncbi:Metallo-hydrolase/oxidoreductase [Hymenopellis radicata]|nr:Metallo-hydrolase/oxidoreductase [Hymenopellis radicata]
MPVQVTLSPFPPRGAHWVNEKPNNFRNPWPSWRTNNIFTTAKMTPIGKPELGPPVIKPTWGVEFRRDSIKSTWLGHACFLVELPANGGRILFDSVFSDRCSPRSMCGPKRFTAPPCSVHDIPDVDAIVISHDHYDHLDTTTIAALYNRSHRPHIFPPLGNGHHFERLEPRLFELTCTPAQHMSGRSVLDRYKSLWCSWVISARNSDSSATVFFAGDTAYRSVHPGEDEDSMPTCPAFREIGERFKEIDLALLPIGAYEPRWFMSTVHCAPQDSMCIFKDLRAKRALGMHWGTWVLTMEELSEPPTRLKETCYKMGIAAGLFDVCAIGETREFSATRVP